MVFVITGSYEKGGLRVNNHIYVSSIHNGS